MIDSIDSKPKGKENGINGQENMTFDPFLIVVKYFRYCIHSVFVCVRAPRMSDDIGRFEPYFGNYLYFYKEQCTK